MDAIKDLFLRAVHARAGMVVQWLVGAALGYLTAWLTSLGIEMPPGILEQLQAGLVGLGALVVTALVQRYQTTQAIALQAALQLPESKQDGWVGPQTVQAAAKAALEAAQKPKVTRP